MAVNMEVDTTSIPLSVLNDDKEHTMYYSQSLPYVNRLDGEAENWLAQVCENIAIHVKAGDLAPGTFAWVKRLESFREMKHALPRETRAKLAKLLYELTVMPGMDTSLVEYWATVCVRLIRKPQRIGPEDLTLDWRPLYQLIKKYISPKIRQKILIAETKHITAAIRLAEYAQRFYPPTAAKEILEEMLPRFTTHHAEDALTVQGFLALFLPVSQPKHSITKEKLFENGMHPREYLPTIFSMWSMVTSSFLYDAQCIELLSRIAEANVSESSQVFSKDEIKTVFTACLRIMNLPVGSRADGSSSNGNRAGGSSGHNQYAGRIDLKAGSALILRRKPEKYKALSRFMVYTMFPDEEGGQSYVLDLLSNLVQAIELYYHPSNHGTWSYSLAAFTQCLSGEFLRRWREEEEEDCDTPSHRRLTPDMKKKFVLTLRPLAYLSMFGKDNYIVNFAQTTLRRLAWLEPSLIFPGLLERIYSSLETLTETHRTSSAIHVLTDVTHPLLCREHYPAGGKHLLPLLHLVTPGIDLIDPLKSLSIIQFIANAVMLVPVRDLTKECDYDPAENEVRYEGMEIDTTGQEKELSSEEEDKLCKASTEGFEDWLAKFLRQTFMVFENLPTSYKSNSPAAEISVVHVLLATCDILFQQLSDDLYDMALRMVVDFATTKALPNAFHPMGMLCRGLTMANPAKAAKRILPLCIANIQTELEHGASSQIVNSSTATPIQSDSTLHWYQNILYEVCSALGAELLNYKQELISIVHEMLDKCKTRTGFMWASKVLRHSLKSLLAIYPKEMRNFAPDEWADEEFMKRSHRLWGKPGDPRNLKIDWHVPTEEEKEMAMELLETFLVPSIGHVQELLNDQGLKSAAELTNEYCKHLAIVRNCLLGSTCLIGEDGVDQDKNPDEIKSNSGDEEPVASYSFAKLEAGYALTDPSDPRYIRAKELRRNIAELIHKALTYFYEKSEDDIERMKMILKLARTFLDDMGVDKSKLDQLKAAYSYAKPMFLTPLSRKQYPRRLLVLRAHLHHLQRLRHNAHGRIPGSLHMSIFHDLVKLSMSSYAVVRKASQSALAATAKNFNGAKGSLMPSILDGLRRDESLGSEEQADRLKGALYLLRHKSILSSCLRDWRFIPKFIMSLCQAQHEDKVSVQTLIRKIFLDYVTHFTFRNYQIIDTSHVNENIQQLCDLAAVSNRIDAVTSKVMERHERQSKAYQELMEFLIAFMQDSKVHWRFATMAASLLDHFVRPQYAPTADLAKIACECTLSDLPGLRHIGSELTTQLLDFIKRRTYAKGDETTLLNGSIENPLKKQVPLEVKDENFAKDFISKLYVPVTETNANECLFADDQATGWLVWPKVYTFYAAHTGDVFLPNIDEKCQGAYEEFRKTVTSDDYWKKLGDFMSQDISGAQEDVFHLTNALLCKSIFKMYWDEPLSAAKQIITQFCDATDQKNQQRAGAELVAGLVRGMKHWPVAKSAKVWEWLSPLLQKTFANITPDSLTYWESCVQYCAQRRDPRRILPLIEVIFSAEFDPTSDAAFAEARKLMLMKAILNSLTWCASPLAEKLLPKLFDNIQHPYKQVREAIASDINAIVQLHWIPGFHSVDELLERARQEPLMPLTLQDQDCVYLDGLVENLDRWQSEAQPAHVAGAKDYINGSKTVLCWLVEGLTKWRVAGTIPYIRLLWPKIFIMQDVRDDQDLQQMSGNVLKFFAQYYYPPSIIASILEQFVQILTGSESWRIRIRALPILQVFFFKNYFFMEAEQRARIMDVVSDMLLDTQLEVRQMAAVTLGGLVRCSQRDTIDIVKERFTKLLQTNIPRRKRDRETGKIIETPEFRVALLKKHAGVLGLSCLVNAFPYDVPKWMPEVVCQLAECMSDPAEIQATIRKTFSDFKRTHCDTWHEDMTKFTEEQLSTLNDVLISPSYYA